MSRLLAALALVAAAGALHAQEPAPGGHRLGDFYLQVARLHPRLQAARSFVRAAEARTAGARRPPDPQLQLGVMNRNLPSLAPMRPLGMTQLQLMQMVPTRGKLSLAGEAAEAQAAIARAQVDDVAWELRTQVAMAFYDVWATDERLGVARETIRLLHDVASTAESMYRVGEGRQADVLRARVELARMREDTLRMQAMREGMAARLDALLMRDGGPPMGALSLPRFPEAAPDRRWLDSVAVQQRPMVRAGLEAVHAATASEALARRELVPDVQLGVQLGQQRAIAADGMPGGLERMASLMVGASIPVFARSRQLRMREEATAMRLMARADLAAMRAETTGRVGEVHAALQSARRLVQLYRTEILPQAEATVASALAAYRTGGVDFMTLLDNRMSVNRYRQEVASLEAEEGKAWAELEMLTGRELLDPYQVAIELRATPDDSTAFPARRHAPVPRGDR